MPTTIYHDPTSGFKAWTFQARTDSSGTPVTDADGEEARLPLEFFTEGIVSPSTAFQVVEDSPAGMSVVVGSGTAETDLAVVAGTASGQGNYLGRLQDATTTVTVPAADVSNPRIDEVYLVPLDNQFDSGGLTLFRIGYREGDPGSSPAAPGPDGAWDSFLKFATISVSASVTEITNTDITDERVMASPQPTVMAAWEVDESTEVVSSGTLGSDDIVASVDLSVPANWSSWKCDAWASFVASGTASTYEAYIEIDGTAQQSKIASTDDDQEGAIGGRRTGISTTGTRTITLKASTTGGSVTMNWIYLYARAVRTS